jgi:superfamily I DNA/RNA helicase
LETPRASSLGEGGSPEFYQAEWDEDFRWYRYLFLGRGKPSTHVRALGGVPLEQLKDRAPSPLVALLRRVNDELFPATAPAPGAKRGGVRVALVPPDSWRPTGIDELEPDAWRALRREGNTAVIAGPGAGKTEFLAQLAAYLLQTGKCARPHRILAISFKRDAAENLAERVRRRCTPAHASRFVSMTFDAFSKGLVDRFLGALPPMWRPTRPYDVTMAGRRDVNEALIRARIAAPTHWKEEIRTLDDSKFEAEHVGATRLPLAPWTPATGTEFATLRWWSEHLQRKPKSALTFTMINRLGELILRARSEIMCAIRTTYPFVFVDEFQDTTFAQYDLLASAFRGAKTTLTAVGDPKQRIMLWAGARVDAFARFEKDFSAAKIPLRLNHRSSPELVRIQHFVARALDPGAVKVSATPKRAIAGDVAQIWRFGDEATEARLLAEWIAADLPRRKLLPRDYAILVRQKADQFERRLGPAFAEVGLKLRNEAKRLGRSTLQDVLVDELTRIVLSVLRLASLRRAPSAWATASEAILRLRGVDVEDHRTARSAERELISAICDLRTRMASVAPNEASSEMLATRVLGFLGLPAIARAYADYGTWDTLEIAVEALRIHLVTSAAGAATWQECLNAFEGREQVPLMTVHKSKGLEYDTTVFVGLDDDTWWSHKPGDSEGTATFFVGLSRAKQRAIFTFCRERGQRVRVADLYKLLNDAGVPELAF